MSLFKSPNRHVLPIVYSGVGTCFSINSVVYSFWTIGVFGSISPTAYITRPEEQGGGIHLILSRTPWRSFVLSVGVCHCFERSTSLLTLLDSLLLLSSLHSTWIGFMEGSETSKFGLLLIQMDIVYHQWRQSISRRLYQQGRAFNPRLVSFVGHLRGYTGFGQPVLSRYWFFKNRSLCTNR